MKFLNFFYFCGSFLPSWIRIRISNPDSDTDPRIWLNREPILIRNTGFEPNNVPYTVLFCIYTVLYNCDRSKDGDTWGVRRGAGQAGGKSPPRGRPRLRRQELHLLHEHHEGGPGPLHRVLHLRAEHGRRRHWSGLQVSRYVCLFLTVFGSRSSVTNRRRIRIFRITGLNFFHPWSLNLSILTQNLFLSSQKYDLGCSSRIRILIFYPSRIPDPVVK